MNLRYWKVRGLTSSSSSLMAKKVVLSQGWRGASAEAVEGNEPSKAISQSTLSKENSILKASVNLSSYKEKYMYVWLWQTLNLCQLPVLVSRILIISQMKSICPVHFAIIQGESSIVHILRACPEGGWSASGVEGICSLVSIVFIGKGVLWQHHWCAWTILLCWSYQRAQHKPYKRLFIYNYSISIFMIINLMKNKAQL